MNHDVCMKGIGHILCSLSVVGLSWYLQMLVAYVDTLESFVTCKDSWLNHSHLYA
jgi:hypothetical protein